MQVLDEALNSSNSLIPSSPTSSSDFKFNIQVDSNHENKSNCSFSYDGCNNKSSTLLKSSPCNSKPQLYNNNLNVDDHDETKINNESSRDAPQESIYVIVNLEKSLHSWDVSESKQDDGSSQTLPQSQDDFDIKYSLSNKLNKDNITNTEHTRQTHCLSPQSIRKKRCLSVRTLEESLTSINSIYTNKLNKDIPKEVSFSKIHIREYEFELGNNPACVDGPPISIGWKYSTKDDIELKDVVDNNKIYVKVCDKKPGPNDHFYIKPHDRLEMVKERGYTKKDISKCMVDVRTVQYYRKESKVASEKEEQRKEAVNIMTKKIKKFFRSKDQKKQDQIMKSFCLVNNRILNTV